MSAFILFFFFALFPFSRFDHEKLEGGKFYNHDNIKFDSLFQVCKCDARATSASKKGKKRKGKKKRKRSVDDDEKMRGWEKKKEGMIKKRKY